MPVPSTMGDLSVTESANSPAGSDAISNSLDNYLRAVQAILRTTNNKAADIASASSVPIGAATGEFIAITGTTTITSFDSVAAGIRRDLYFSGALTLTNSSNIQLPGGANYTTTAGDVLSFRSLGSGQWICTGLMNTASPIQQATNTSNLTINNSTTLQLIPGCQMSFTAKAATYQIDVYIKGTQASASAGVRVAVDVTSGSVSDGEVFYELIDYPNYNTTSIGFIYSGAATQGNVTTATALLGTNWTTVESAKWIIQGKGHVTFNSSGSVTIGLYFAQATNISADTIVEKAYFRLTRA